VNYTPSPLVDPSGRLSILSPNDVSGDGSIVVGFGTNLFGTTADAFRWSQSGVISLPDSPAGDHFYNATGVSDDGQVIIGYGKPALGFQPLIWDAANGTHTFASVAASLGEDVTDLSHLSIRAISGDGKWVVGDALTASGSREAFVAMIPEPSVAALAFGVFVIIPRRRRRARQ